MLLSHNIKSRCKHVASPRNTASESPCCLAWDIPHWGHHKVPCLPGTQLWDYFLFCFCWRAAEAGRRDILFQPCQIGSFQIYLRLLPRDPEVPTLTPSLLWQWDACATALGDPAPASQSPSAPSSEERLPYIKPAVPHSAEDKDATFFFSSHPLHPLFISSIAQRPLKAHWAAFGCVSVG